MRTLPPPAPLLPRPTDPSYLYKAEVREVIDADAFLLDINLGFEVIRLTAVDEKGQPPFSRRASPLYPPPTVLPSSNHMKTSTASAVLPCTPETFGAAFLDESYLRALYLEELEYRAFAVIEIGEISRKLRIVPKMKLPANLDPKSKPRKDVVAMHGTVRIEASGDGHCRRTDDFSVEAKMFGLVSLIESSIDKELQSARAKEYAFLKRWVEKRGV